MIKIGHPLLTVLFCLLNLSGVGQPKRQGAGLMFVLLNTNPERKKLDKETTEELQAEHQANIEKMSHEGKLLVAGPFEGGGGIFILKTDSPIEAGKWLKSDPAIAAGWYHVEVFPWVLRKGGTCTVDEDTGFVQYTFVRYSTFIFKSNVRQVPRLMEEHDRYLKKIIATGNVVSEGIFINDDGGTLVVRGDIDDSVIMGDPTVRSGFMEPDIRKVWVRKGAFCED